MAGPFVFKRSTLTNKQLAFIEHYLTCWNATEAARKAGYAEPNVQGSRLLVNVSIQAAVKERLADLQMGADEVLTRLTEHARGSIEDFGDIGDKGSFVMDLAKAQRLGKLGNVKNIKPAKVGYELELYDAQAALEKLGRAHGLFNEKSEVIHSGEVSVKTLKGSTSMGDL